MPISIQVLLLVATTLYQAIASWLEDRQPPPGQLIDVGQYWLHLYIAGEGSPTIVLDHSLGGVEGYFLIEELSKLARVCIYDRAGYGWSDHSPYPRSSDQIVKELDTLLVQAGIEPPYILVGNSFGSYNIRLYAHLFPQKVVGIVLTDALHEIGMLKMSAPLQALKLVGKVEGREFEYIRHGTQSLIANFDVATGKMIEPTCGDSRTEAKFCAHAVPYGYSVR